MDLSKRRQEIVDWHKLLESVPGSGWHQNDPDMRLRLQRGEKPLSDRPVILQDDDRVHVVGASAAAVKAALEVFLGRAEGRAAAGHSTDLIGLGDKYQAAVVKNIRRALAQAESGNAIDLFSQEWNYVNHALTTVGVHVVSATASVPPPLS